MKEDNQAVDNNAEDAKSSESSDDQFFENVHLLFGLVIVNLLLVLSGYFRVRRQILKLEP